MPRIFLLCEGIECREIEVMAHRTSASTSQSYVPKNILITGGAGFIGSHVVCHFVRTFPHYNVTVLDKLDYCSSLGNLTSIQSHQNYNFVHGDILDAKLVMDVLEKEDVDTIVHFAAQTHVDNSFGNSLSFSVNNTLGTHTLLETARCFGRVRRFINVSTDEVYGDESFGQEVGSTERSVLAPTNPYSAAKAGAEMMCHAYLKSYGMPIIVTRGNNVYGPGQYPEKLVPKFILLAMDGRPLPIHGDGSATRSFLYVDDVVMAFDAILHHGVIGEVYNVGTQDERTVLQVAKDVLEKLCSSSSSVEHVEDRAFNDMRYFIGSEKLAGLGWRPLVGWEDGLARTIEWFKSVDREWHWRGGNIGRALLPHPFLCPEHGSDSNT